MEFLIVSPFGIPTEVSTAAQGKTSEIAKDPVTQPKDPKTQTAPQLCDSPEHKIKVPSRFDTAPTR